MTIPPQAHGLFDPAVLGPLTLKNRIVMAPMTTLLERAGGDRYERFYDARARGGAAMITLNLQAVDPGVIPRKAGAGPAAAPLIALNGEGHLPRLEALTARLRAHGSLACAQLAVGGTVALGPGDSRIITLSPSGLDVAASDTRPDISRLPFFERGRPATPGELAVVVEAVARAARRAASCGFDAVQVSAAGGSLLAQFLNPRLNARDDEYGGNVAGRGRLVLEALRAVRAAVSSSVALLCRINGDDLLAGGMAADDYAELVPLLEDAGAQAIDILPGGFLTRVPVHHPSVPEGTFARVSGTLRRRSRVPVFAGTRITTPGCAARILAGGDADVISLGTALIADPEWPRKAEDGRALDIRPCTVCGQCWNDLAVRHVPVGCSVNPFPDEDEPRQTSAAAAPQRVTVVGAGVSGLTAAAAAARAGHLVTVLDRGTAAGGRLLDGTPVPHRNGLDALLGWLTRQAAGSGVAVRLGVDATPGDVLLTCPDVVVLALGHAAVSDAGLEEALAPRVRVIVARGDANAEDGVAEAVRAGRRGASLV